MATVSIPDLLKAAERPLALFLDDALRSIDARYFDRFVRPYVATASPDYPGKRVFSGNERLRDSRNQDKTSFLDCDLLFLTHYFEFATDYESWRDANERPLPMTSMGKVEFPNLTRVFPFTQKGIVTKIAAVRELRNQWSHGHTDEADVHHLSIDISKLLDLFKVEIQHVVQERPGSFRPETKLAVDGYVEKLKAAHKGAPSSEEGPQTPDTAFSSHAADVGVEVKSELSNPRWFIGNRRRVIVSTIAVIAVVAYLLLSRSSGPTETSQPVGLSSLSPITKGLVIVVGRLPSVEKSELLSSKIAETIFPSEARILISALVGDDKWVRDTVAVDRESVRHFIERATRQCAPVTNIDEYSFRFRQGYKELMNVRKSGVEPVFAYIGQLPSVSRSVWKQISSGEKKVYEPGMGAGWTLSIRTQPYFVVWGAVSSFHRKMMLSMSSTYKSLKPIELTL